MIPQKFIFQPWHLLVVVLAGLMNREQQQLIEYLQAENKVLKETHGGKRILLNDKQRRRLAVKGKVLGRKRLQSIATLFSPDTILRWHRQLIARKWDYSNRRSKIGRPAVSDEVVKLVLRFAKENPSWGYDRIADALKNLDHNVTDQTIGNILKRHGVEPAPERETRTSWKTFLQAHWGSITATDFTTVEVWTAKGLVTYYLLFAMELKTRRVCFAGCTPNPDDTWMKQVARNLTESEDGFLGSSTHILMDRDTKFSESFRHILATADVEPVVLPPRSPNLNAHIERFMKSVKHECLSKLVFFGDSQLRTAVSQYLLHYHHERNHQGIEHRIIESMEVNPGDAKPVVGEIECVQRLGGLLRYYHRSAA